MWRVASALKERGPLNIVTSALAPVEELGPVQGMKVHLTGGTFRLENLDFVGSRAIQAFADFHVNLALLSADAFVPGLGAFTTDEASAAIAAAMADVAERVIVAVDSSKFSRNAPFRVLCQNRISIVLTDAGVSPATLNRMAEDSYQVVVAE